jgi:hypothetical protein
VNPHAGKFGHFPYNWDMNGDTHTPSAQMQLAKHELLILCARIGYNP